MSVREIPMYIDGQPVMSQSQEWRDVVNPATQDVVARVPFCTSEEVERAIASAKTAFKEWRKVPLGKRMRIMLKLQALIRENTAELAALITEEHGKTLPDAEGEVGRGLEVVEHACSITSPTAWRAGGECGQRGGRLYHASAAGCGGGHYRLQFSDHAALFHVPVGDCHRKHLRLEAFRARPEFYHAARGTGT
ncbi:hypothetical protein HAALTHF_25350n [Vreelandella aquamarina]|nr:hypothetical protein HAALTHF_25350n [Halomonas axialensis]